MSCKKFQKQLYQYLEGELPQDTATQLELHIKSCHACELTLVKLKAVNNLVDKEKNEYIPNPFMSAKVIAMLDERKAKALEPNYSLRYLTIATLAAAGIAIGIFIGSLFSSSSTLFDNSSSTLAVEQLADEFMPEGENNPYTFEITDNEIQTKP